MFEKILDRKIKQYLEFNHNQRGFTHQPGTYINASIISGCLKKSKMMQKDCVIAFLDIVQAFDSIGHSHLANTIDETCLPHHLKNICKNLITDNESQIVTSKEKTQKIKFYRGIPQGSPISPTLFNKSIDFILNEINEPGPVF